MSTSFSHATLSVDAAVEALRAADFEVQLAPQPAKRTLLDTFDGRLHAKGIRLELVDSTLEVHQAGSPAAIAPAHGAPRFATDLPAGPLRARLAPVLEARALLPLVSVSASRHLLCRRNREGKTVAAVTITAQPLPDHAWVAEIEELRGHEDRAADAAALLTGLGAIPLDGDLLTLAAGDAGVDVAGVSTSPTIPLDSRTPAIEGFVAVLHRLEECIDATWEGTIAEIDTEFLHDLRVAVRRTRSVLSLGKRVLPDVVRDQFGEDFRWFGEITGRARDLDVYLLEWHGYAAELAPQPRAALEPVHAHLVQHTAAAHRRLVEAMRSPRAAGVRHRWREWLAAPTSAEHGERALGTVVARRLRSAQRRVIGEGRAITPASPPEALHELRKRAKKLRYLVECFGGLLPADQRKAFVKTLKGLQDNLGEHQDAQIHADELRAIAHELEGSPTTDTILALGQLRERLEGRRAAARTEFGERFAAYDTKATRRQVAALRKAMAP